MLDQGEFVVVGQEPVGGDALAVLQQWLVEHPAPAIALRPNVGGATGAPPSRLID
ncbi:MAG: hypothetical protein KDA61_20945 [Planctomycetales bacterium]|nr:hypothetical protein [Planctomycetales bacterium]